MTEFNERLEGEMKTHEKEMLRKATIAKYGPKSFVERIQYVMSTYQHDSWTAEELFAKLTELGLNGTNTAEDVKEVFNNPANSFPPNVNQ
jgi:hypothetical protein